MARAAAKRTLDVVQVPITELVLDNRNARKGDVESIASSLRELGQHRPAVVQRSTNRVIAGNHMILAAESLGWTDIAVVYVDDDDATAVRRGIADNATSMKGGWNDDVLKELLGEVGHDIPGLDQKVIDRLFKELDLPTDPVYPILARPGEGYDYVVFFCDGEIDRVFIETVFGEKFRDWRFQNGAKASKTPAGRSKLLPVSRLRDALSQAGAIPQIDQSDD